MTVQQLPDFLKEHWLPIREQLLRGTYKPRPVKRVEIPKPGGGVRKLGIPTVLDRFIQQAVMQVVQRSWDRTFSDHSYGFRPGRSAHQAVEQAQKYIAAGYLWVVGLDLEKFFDRVNHDRLMAKLAERIEDQRPLRLIRTFLQAGVMENGLWLVLRPGSLPNSVSRSINRKAPWLGPGCGGFSASALRRQAYPSGGPLQEASARTDAPDARHQH